MLTDQEISVEEQQFNEVSKLPSNFDDIDELVGLSTPVLTVNLTTRSQQIPAFLKRSWNFTSKVLARYDMSVRIRAKKFSNEMDLNIVDDEIAKIFNEQFELLAKEKSRYQHMIEEENIQLGNVQHTKVRTFNIEIHTPLANQLVDILKAVDENIVLVATLWLNQQVTSKEYESYGQGWKRKLFQFCTRIVKTVKSAQIAVNTLESKASEQNEQNDNATVEKIVNLDKSKVEEAIDKPDKKIDKPKKTKSKSIVKD